MKKERIFLYSNQPVIQFDGRYYTKFRNFIDFLSELAKMSDAYRLVVPCLPLEELPDENYIAMDLPDAIIEVAYHARSWEENITYWKPLIASFRNALLIRSQVLSALHKGQKVTFAGPGPNSFLFWISLIVPKSVRFAFFIRGDSLRGYQEVYRGKIVYPIVTGIVRIFHNRIMRLARQARAHVFPFGERLKTQYAIPESKITIIAPLIDTPFIRMDERADISEGRPLKVLSVGRLSEEKNILSLLDACALACKSGNPFSLSIVGSGPMEGKIRNRIADPELSNWVKLLGFVAHGDGLIAEFDRHDVLCLPSHTEGTPRTVIEAFARGMPVLATPVGGLSGFFPAEIRFLEAYGAKDILKGITWCDTHRQELSDLGRKGKMAIRPFLIYENAVRVDKILRHAV